MEKKLPEIYEKKKINLNSLNLGGFAWTREDFLSFLHDPISEDFAILGGDVLSMENYPSLMIVGLLQNG